MSRPSTNTMSDHLTTFASCAICGAEHDPALVPELDSTLLCPTCTDAERRVRGPCDARHAHRPPMDFATTGLAPGTLVEITREQYDYMFNVLPPCMARGCFAMGEPLAHTDDGVTFHWAGCRAGRYFRCHGTRAQAERAFAPADPTTTSASAGSPPTAPRSSARKGPA